MKKILDKKKILIGAHLSISGGLEKSAERAASIGCTTMQIFTKNNKAWFGKTIDEEEAKLFRKAVKSAGLSKIMAHCSYLINLASAKREVEQKSVAALKHELHRCEQLGIPYLVLHPGSHLGAGVEKGIKKVVKNLATVLKTASGKTTILLETMSGQGTNIGATFEEIKEIYKNCEYKKLLGVCLDTCHIFAAGYDISTPEEYEKTIKKFQRIIGLSRLKAIHINDSKTECGSKKDRHENIGKGEIPIEAFKLIMQDKRLSKIPKILETPSADGMTEYKREVRRLKGFV